MPEPYYDMLSQEFFVCSNQYKIHKLGQDLKWSIVKEKIIANSDNKYQSNIIII